MKEFGVIFDMDGVIINSEPVYQSLNKEIMSFLNIEMGPSFETKYLGITARRKWELIKEEYNLKESIEDLIAIQNRFFTSANWNYNKLLFPSAKPLLNKLKSKNVPLALATSTEKKRVDQVIIDCELTRYFDKVITAEDVKYGKPDPEVFIVAAKQLNLLPESCIVIEDSYNGVLAAKKANMYCIGVKHENINVDLSLVDRKINSLSELLDCNFFENNK